MILIREEIREELNEIYMYYDNGIVESRPLNPPIEPEKPHFGDNSDLKYLESKLLEQDKKVFKLESENADLVLDAAIKDMKIQTLESDMADMMLEILMINGGLK